MTGDSGRAHSCKVVTGTSRKTGRAEVMIIFHGESRGCGRGGEAEAVTEEEEASVKRTFMIAGKCSAEVSNSNNQWAKIHTCNNVVGQH